MAWFKKSIPKTKMVIIHGFAQGVGPSIFKKFKLNFLNYFESDYGFKAFSKLIKKKEAKVFVWGESLEIPLKKYLATKTYIELYKSEKLKATNIEVQKQLHDFINSNTPEIIVCHSMGCYLFLNSIENFQLNDSVKAVYLVQGDFDKSYRIQDKEIIERLEKKDLKITNCYCPWDQALLASSVFNKFTIQAGLGKTNNPQFEDKFFPLYKKVNLHNSSICDKDLYKFIMKI